MIKVLQKKKPETFLDGCFDLLCFPEKLLEMNKSLQSSKKTTEKLNPNIKRNSIFDNKQIKNLTL